MEKVHISFEKFGGGREAEKLGNKMAEDWEHERSSKGHRGEWE